MRQGFIIANLFLISTLVLSGCATHFGARLACDIKAKDGGGVRTWKEKTGRYMVIPPKRAASKSRINTSPAFSAGRVSLLKPSYAFALE